MTLLVLRVLSNELPYDGGSLSGTGGEMDWVTPLRANRFLRYQNRKRIYNPTSTTTTGIKPRPSFIEPDMPVCCGAGEGFAYGVVSGPSVVRVPFGGLMPMAGAIGGTPVAIWRSILVDVYVDGDEEGVSARMWTRAM